MLSHVVRNSLNIYHVRKDSMLCYGRALLKNNCLVTYDQKKKFSTYISYLQACILLVDYFFAC